MTHLLSLTLFSYIAGAKDTECTNHRLKYTLEKEQEKHQELISSLRARLKTSDTKRKDLSEKNRGLFHENRKLSNSNKALQTQLKGLGVTPRLPSASGGKKLTKPDSAIKRDSSQTPPTSEGAAPTKKRKKSSKKKKDPDSSVNTSQTDQTQQNNNFGGTTNTNTITNSQQQIDIGHSHRVNVSFKQQSGGHFVAEPRQPSNISGHASQPYNDNKVTRLIEPGELTQSETNLIHVLSTMQAMQKAANYHNPYN